MLHAPNRTPNWRATEVANAGLAVPAKIVNLFLTQLFVERMALVLEKGRAQFFLLLVPPTDCLSDLAPPFPARSSWSNFGSSIPS